MIDLVKENQALTIIDAAQSVPHIKLDVEDLDCDFLVFSSHKMFGPTGIGVLYGKTEHLNNLHPFLFGGGMINTVTYNDASWAEIPEKFEAGTQNIAESIALGTAIDYLESLTFNKIKEHEQELLEYALQQLNTLDNITIYNPWPTKSPSSHLIQSSQHPSA